MAEVKEPVWCINPKTGARSLFSYSTAHNPITRKSGWIIETEVQKPEKTVHVVYNEDTAKEAGLGKEENTMTIELPEENVSRETKPEPKKKGRPKTKK